MMMGGRSGFDPHIGNHLLLSGRSYPASDSDWSPISSPRSMALACEAKSWNVGVLALPRCCWHCGSWRHFRRACPQLREANGERKSPQATVQPGQPSVPLQRRPGRRVRFRSRGCWCCGSFFHLLRSCPHKQPQQRQRGRPIAPTGSSRWRTYAPTRFGVFDMYFTSSAAAGAVAAGSSGLRSL